MIVTSLMLILAAVALLVLGLVSGSNQLLVGSIAASLVAAIALVIGARQSAAARARGDYPDPVGGDLDESARAPAREPVAAGAPGRPPYDKTAEAATESFPAVAPAQGMAAAGMPAADPDDFRPPAGPPPGTAVPPPVVPVAAAAPPAVPAQPGADGAPRDDEIDDEEDPPDEPVRQAVSPADAARVARLSTPVMVVDGRPRYHLAGCVHLLGRDGEPLPVAEAVELGFTPCSLCEPDTSLLADAR